MPGRAYVSDRYGDERYEVPRAMTLAELSGFLAEAKAYGVPENATVLRFPDMDLVHQIALFYDAQGTERGHTDTP